MLLHKVFQQDHSHVRIVQLGKKKSNVCVKNVSYEKKKHAFKVATVNSVDLLKIFSLSLSQVDSCGESNDSVRPGGGGGGGITYKK